MIKKRLVFFISSQHYEQNSGENFKVEPVPPKLQALKSSLVGIRIYLFRNSWIKLTHSSMSYLEFIYLNLWTDV